MALTSRHPMGAGAPESQAPPTFNSLAAMHEQPLTTTDLQHRAPAHVDAADSAALAIKAAASIGLTPPPRNVPVLDDAGLAAELARLARGQDEVLVIANAYTVCMRHRPASGGAWQMLCCGEFGSYAIEAA